MRTDVMAIMFHFIISVVIVGSYVATVVLGKDDATLQNLALLVAGYWFGAVTKVGVDKLTQKGTPKDGDSE